MRDLSRDSSQLYVQDGVQTFLDNVLIESSQDTTRRWHKPQRYADEPVIKKDRPWEHSLYFTYSNHQVVRDPQDGLFKCWYEDLEGPDEARSSQHFNMFARQLYAESEDGVNWRKPELDVYSVDGRKTNIVMGDDDYGQVHSAAYVIDPHPGTPEQRFRVIYSHMWDRGPDRGHRTACAYSPDGIHWRPYEQLPMMGRCGSHLGDVSTLYYDPDARDFVQITRHFLQGSAPSNPSNPRNPRNPSFNGPHEPHNFASYSQRRLWLCRSHDFLHWSEPVVIAAADDEEDNLDESFYGMPLYKLGTLYLGTVGVLHQVDNTMDVQLLMSRDMLRWQRTAKREPFLAPRGAGYWDAYMVSMVSAPIEVGDELWFYHGGTRYHHDWWLAGPREKLDHPEPKNPLGSGYALGLATLRKDGFAGLYANPLREGIVCTRPMSGVGQKLVINAKCAPGGYVRVEVVDRHDEIVPSCSKDHCDRFGGDSVKHTVTWKGKPLIGHAPDERGRQVCKLRFFLRDAELFSFRFEGIEQS
jgi:hypothetical protein